MAPPKHGLSRMQNFLPFAGVSVIKFKAISKNIYVISRPKTPVSLRCLWLQTFDSFCHNLKLTMYKT